MASRSPITPSATGGGGRRYTALGCRLEPVAGGCAEFSLLEGYLRRGISPQHAHLGAITLTAVFRAARDGDADRFAPHATEPHRRLLWHGSRLTNWASDMRALFFDTPAAPQLSASRVTVGSR